MGKPATNVGGRNGVERLFDRRDQRLNRPCLGTAQKGFDLRPTLLDGVEVWRIGRQPEEPCAPRRQQLFYPGHFVGRQMIPQHTSVGLQGRTQDLADPAGKNFAIDGAVNDPRGLEAVQVQGREQSLMSATILGHTLDPRCPGVARPKRRVMAKLTPASSTNFSRWTSRLWTVSRKAVRNVWTPSVSRSAAWSDFFYRQLEAR